MPIEAELVFSLVYLVLLCVWSIHVLWVEIGKDGPLSVSGGDVHKRVLPTSFVVWLYCPVSRESGDTLCVYTVLFSMSLSHSTHVSLYCPLRHDECIHHPEPVC